MKKCAHMKESSLLFISVVKKVNNVELQEKKTTSRDKE